MSKILNPIPPQGFEIVRDRIALILTTELSAQFSLTGEQDNNATVYLERTVPVNQSEMPIVNVGVQRSDLSSQSVVQTQETILFNIDVYHKSKTVGDLDGDSLANLKMQRLLGICRAILENPVYKRLDFDPAISFIENRVITSIEIGESKRGDALSTSVGRIVFSVRIPEVTQLLLGEILGGTDTEIRLELTDKGYKYTTDI